MRSEPTSSSYGPRVRIAIMSESSEVPNEPDGKIVSGVDISHNGVALLLLYKIRSLDSAAGFIEMHRLK